MKKSMLITACFLIGCLLNGCTQSLVDYCYERSLSEPNCSAQYQNYLAERRENGRIFAQAIAESSAQYSAQQAAQAAAQRAQSQAILQQYQMDLMRQPVVCRPWGNTIICK